MQIVREEYNAEGYPTDVLVFESACGQRSLNKSSDPFDDVVDADYKLGLPKHSFIIKQGDILKFTDVYTSEVIRGTVQASKVWNFGANVWFKRSGNS